MSNLIELCAGGPAPIPLTFLSSVGATNNWGVHHQGPVPERIIHGSDSAAEECGYAQSKLLAEQLLDRASRTLGRSYFSSTVCLFTQIAGPVDRTRGMWKKSESFPNMLRNSKTLGALPRRLASMNTLEWVPINQLADSITELVKTGDTITVLAEEVEMLHAVNPQTVEWSEISATTARRLFGESSEEHLVDLGEWIRELQQSQTNSSQQDLGSNPGLKLLDWFIELDSGQEEASYATQGIRKRSLTFRNMTAVNGNWLQRWVEQWPF